MQNYSGFRIEIAKTSLLGTRLSTLSKYLRNRSYAKMIVRNKVKTTLHRWGDIQGTWTVRPSGSISFKGTGPNGLMVEYAYGQLSIGYNLDKPGYQSCISSPASVKFMKLMISKMFPYMPSKVALDLSINVA